MSEHLNSPAGDPRNAPGGSSLSRRAFLAVTVGGVLAGCSPGDDSSTDVTGDGTPSSAATESTGAAGATAGADESGAVGDAVVPPLTGAMFAAVGICTTLPETTAGPFPLDDQFRRVDITEGYPGHPLRLGVRVVDDNCEPIPGADVEIWHADASGDYSAFEDGGDGKDEGDGTTFLRGTQTSNAEGVTEFQTIYPGWYTGRAIHIHVRVHVAGEAQLTSQLYFDEGYTAQILQTGEYAQFGPPDTSNAEDGLIGDPATDGSGIVLADAPTTLGPGTLGLVNVAI